MTDKLKPFVSGGTFPAQNARRSFLQPYQPTAKQDQRQVEAERRYFAFAQMRLGNVVRNTCSSPVAAIKFPHSGPAIIMLPEWRRTAQSGSSSRNQRAYPVPARRRPVQQNAAAAATPANRGMTSFTKVCAGMTRHRECHAYQQHNRQFQRTAEARKSARPCQSHSARLWPRLKHLISDRPRRFHAILPNIAPSATTIAVKPSKSRPSLFHGRGDFIKRHPLKAPRPLRRDHY